VALLHSLTKFLAERLKLKVNQAKSAVARPWQRQFLGYRMTFHQKPKLRIAAPSLERLTEKVRALSRGARGATLAPRFKPSTHSCAVGRPTSSWPKPSARWKSRTEGYGISYAASCGDNGNGRIGAHAI